MTSIPRQWTGTNCLASSIPQLESGKMVNKNSCFRKTTTDTEAAEFHQGRLLLQSHSFVPLNPPSAGLFSSLMREQANVSHTGPKWIVLDGDIDPMWIESLNTVMDDNKVPPSRSLIRSCAAPHSLREEDVAFRSLQRSPPRGVSACGCFSSEMIQCC